MSPVNQSIAEKGTKCNAAGKEARQAVYRYSGIALPGVRRGGDSQGKHRWALSACIGILGRRSASLFARVSLSRTFILRFSSRWEMHAGVVRIHWYTEQLLSQLQRLCPALPDVRKRTASVRGTCIVVPHAALLAVPDAPPRFFAHWARSASVPQGALGSSPPTPSPGNGACRSQGVKQAGGASEIARSADCGTTMRVSRVPRPLLRFALIARFYLRIENM